MTHPKGRTGHGPALRGFPAAACVVVTLAGAAGGCARPGTTPSGTSEVTIVASAAPAPRATGAVPVPGPVTDGGCGGGRAAVVRPTASLGDLRRSPAPPVAKIPRAGAARTSPAPGPMGAEEARERARRVLEQQRAAIPGYRDVPPEAAARAADCIVQLRMELNLRRAAHGTLTADDIRAALAAAKLTGPIVHPDLRFAASTDDACIVGTADPADLRITPLPPTGQCRPTTVPR